MMMLVLIALALLGLPLVARRLATPSWVLAVALAVFVGHVLVGLVLVHSGRLGGDYELYHRVGQQIAGSLAGQDVSISTSAGKEGWPWVLGILYYWSSPEVAIGVCVNAAALAVLPLVFYDVVRGVSTERASRVAVWLASASPAYWLWGSLPLREALSALFISLFVMGLVRVTSRSAKPGLPLIVSGLVGVSVFRGAFAIILLVALIIALFVNVRRSQRRLARFVLTIPILIIVAIAIQSFYADYQDTLTVDRAMQVTQSQQSAGSGFSRTATSVGIPGLVESAFRASPVVLAGPFPWQLPSYPVLVPEMIFWWSLLGLTALSLRFSSARAIALPLLVVALGMLFALSVYSGNYGTLVRIRAQSVPILIPLAAIVFENARATMPSRPRALAERAT